MRLLGNSGALLPQFVPWLLAFTRAVWYRFPPVRAADVGWLARPFRVARKDFQGLTAART